MSVTQVAEDPNLGFTLKIAELKKNKNLNVRNKFLRRESWPAAVAQ